MAEENVIVKIPKANVCLNISNISKLENVWSPEFWVQGLPWKVQIQKLAMEGKEYMAIHLYSSKEDMPPNWSQPAIVSFKLLPFNNSTEPIEGHYSYAYNDSDFGRGFPEFILWTDLFDMEKGYVKNDTINLEVNIEVADPDDRVKSKLSLESIESSCESLCCVTTLRLSLTNIENLIAVRAPIFHMQFLPWQLMFHKTRPQALSVVLESLISDEKKKFDSNVHVNVKLIAKEGGQKKVEKTVDERFKEHLGCLQLDVVSWEELIDSKNKFVNENSIEMEVKIKMSKSEGIACNHQNSVSKWFGFRSVIKLKDWMRSMLSSSNDENKLKCSICFDDFCGKNVSSTKCGHLFCSTCITKSIQARQKCPSCNTVTSLADLHPVYLPFTH